MPTLSPAMLQALEPFVPLFSGRVWPRVLVLVAGTLLVPGKRTATAALRVMGLAEARRFERYHRVLHRARWSSLTVSRVLLKLLVATIAPTGPLLLGIDETIERRWGKRIPAKGIYWDSVRSSHEYFVKASGLRWMCLMLLVPIPVGRARLGAPVLDRAGAVGTLRAGAWAAPQDSGRVGAPVALAGAALVARPAHRCRGG